MKKDNARHRSTAIGHHATEDAHRRDQRREPRSPGEVFDELVHIMRRLRAPDGCPWDREQNFETLKPYLIEEAFEVLEAIGGQTHCEELGDLLLQIVFQAQLAHEYGQFDITHVIESIRDKMISRHPHVFGDADARSAAHVREAWERRKRDARRAQSPHASILDGIPQALPALLQATRMTEKASRVGFDWRSQAEVWHKLEEELDELREVSHKDEDDKPLPSSFPEEPKGLDREAIEHEFGDVLFTLVNLGRFLGVNPEEALRKANRRFDRRFREVEMSLHAEGLKPENVSLEELDRRWERAKMREHTKEAPAPEEFKNADEECPKDRAEKMESAAEKRAQQ